MSGFGNGWSEWRKTRRPRIANDDKVRHVVLMWCAMNEIDASALAFLETLNHNLALGGIRLHLSKVRGPVGDGLARSDLLEHLTGQVFLSQFDAYETSRHRDADPAARAGPAPCRASL